MRGKDVETGIAFGVLEKPDCAAIICYTSMRR